MSVDIVSRLFQAANDGRRTWSLGAWFDRHRAAVAHAVKPFEGPDTDLVAKTFDDGVGYAARIRAVAASPGFYRWASLSTRVPYAIVNDAGHLRWRTVRADSRHEEQPAGAFYGDTPGEAIESAVSGALTHDAKERAALEDLDRRLGLTGPKPDLEDAFVDLRAAVNAGDLEGFRDALEALDMGRQGLAMHEAYRVRSILDIPEPLFRRALKAARVGVQGDGVAVEDLFGALRGEMAAVLAKRRAASADSAQLRARMKRDAAFRAQVESARAAVKSAQEQARAYEALGRSKLPDGSYAAPQWQARVYRREYQKAVEALRRLEASA